MTNQTFTNQIEDPKLRSEYRKIRYELAMIEKQKLKSIPSNHDPLESLETLKRLYQILKDNHNDLPKLKPNTLRLPYKKCSLREAHSHHDKKQVCFSKAYLSKLAMLSYEDLTDRYYATSGLFSMCYLLAHEITHWKIKGIHNKRFYKAYHRYHDTLINLLISGELYSLINEKPITANEIQPLIKRGAVKLF